MQNDRLLPCPFCGGDKVGIWHNRSVSPLIKGSHEVHCYDCHFGLKQEKTEEDAIKHWNTRKPMERIVWQMEKRCSSFNCKVCRHYGDGTGTCNEDCTDALIDDLFDIVKGGVDNAG